MSRGKVKIFKGCGGGYIYGKSPKKRGLILSLEILVFDVKCPEIKKFTQEIPYVFCRFINLWDKFTQEIPYVFEVKCPEINKFTQEIPYVFCRFINLLGQKRAHPLP